MGNTSAKLSNSLALEYEQDGNDIDVEKFYVTEASSIQEALAKASFSASSSTDRKRQFSTFHSAGIVSMSLSDSENKLKLKDILEGGGSVLMEPGEFDDDAIFQRRQANYEFRVRIEKLEKLRLLRTKRLDGGLYDLAVLGKPIPQSILKKTNLKSLYIGIRTKSMPSDPPYVISEDIFIPQASESSKNFHVFLIAGDENRVIAKAKAAVMTESDKEKMKYIDQHMTEREEKMKNLLESINDETILNIYNREEMKQLLEKKKNVTKRPIRFLLGEKDCLLAYRVFESANKAAIAANLLFFLNDSTFLEPLASMLSTKNALRVVLIDIRGFGYSGGKRGKLPKPTQAYRDILQFVRHFRGVSEKPIILGGFFLSCGILVNYDSWHGRENVDGYCLLNPMLGRKFMVTIRKETFKKIKGKSKMIKRNMKRFWVARLSRGKIWGNKYVLKLGTSKNIYDISPMYVSAISANFLLSLQVKNPAKQFTKMSAPLSVFIGEKDEFFVPSKLESMIEPYLVKKNDFFQIIPNVGSLGLLNESDESISDWVYKLPAVQNWESEKYTSTPVFTFSDLQKLRMILPDPVYQSSRKSLEAQNYAHKKKVFTCLQCGVFEYDTFEPLSLPGRPIACVIFICPRYNSFFLAEFANLFQVQIVRIDPISNMKRLSNAFKTINGCFKLLKANFPAATILLCAVSEGCDTLLRYVNWKYKESFNGMILISPLVKLSKSKIEIDKRSKEEKRLLSICGFSDSLYTNCVDIETFSKMISNSNFPFNITCPISNGVKPILLKNHIKGSLKPPFKVLNEVPFDFVGLLSDGLGQIGSWIAQLSSSVSPRTTLVLQESCMNDFEPIQMVGKGTFGKVWLVRHLETKRFMALKVLKKSTIIHFKQQNQVVNEKEILKECHDCPFIVSFNGSFQDSKNLYILMEYLIGGELYGRITKTGKLSANEAKFYISEVIVALSFMHERGIIYRDLKPENIVLDALGHVRIVDFGFSRHFDEEERCSSFCGSPYYIAPEMLSNQKYGLSVDIWAIGVLLYEMLCGAPPFSGKTANEVYRKILFTDLNIPSHVGGDARDLINSLLKQSVDRRIGCGEDGKVSDIMNHKYFKGIDWDRVKRKQTTPPFQPQFSFDGDTSNFTQCASSITDFASSDYRTDKYGDTFASF